MARVLLTASLPIVAVFLSGCGTLANVSVGARQGWTNAQIYGGVLRDIKSAENFVDHSWSPKSDPDLMQDIGTVVGVILVAIDVPLSAVADTVTLPITVPVAIWDRYSNRANISRKSEPPDGGADNRSPTVPAP